MPKTQKTFDRSWGLVYTNIPRYGGHPARSTRGAGGTLYPGLGLGIWGGSISSRALN